jgi:hypothetical protein
MTNAATRSYDLAVLGKALGTFECEVEAEDVMPAWDRITHIFDKELGWEMI